jgi:hypothetical protein
MDGMSRVLIQIGEDRVGYDGNVWTAVSGERSELLVTVLRSSEHIYKREAAGHRDFGYAFARAAAEDFRGKIVEYQPDPPR